MSVEEKDFCWLCSVLTANYARVPVVESVFLVKEEIVMWVYSTKSGKIKKKSIVDLPDKSAVFALNHFISRHKDLSTGSDLICTLSYKNSRVAVDWDKVEESGVLQAILARSSVIQNAFEDVYSPPVYEVGMEWTEGKYVTSFQVKRSNATVPVFAPRLWYKILSLLKVILRLIERTKHRLVTHLTAEFLLSPSTGDVYLYGCQTLKISDSPWETQKKTGNYRIGTPLGIGDPVETQESKDGVVCVVKETLESPAASGFLPKLRKSGSPPSGYENANFRELLALNYAKTRPGFQYQSFDTVFRRLDEECQGELEEEAKKTEQEFKLPPSLIRRASRLIVPESLAALGTIERKAKPKEMISHHYSSTTIPTYPTPKHRHSPSYFPGSDRLFARGQLDRLFSHTRGSSQVREETTRPAKYYFTTLKQ